MYITKMFHIIKNKGIDTKGHNWATLMIKVEKQQELIIVNTYTKHGWELETLTTLEQAQNISMYDIPWIWGVIQQITCRAHWQNDHHPCPNSYTNRRGLYVYGEGPYKLFPHSTPGQIPCGALLHD